MKNCPECGREYEDGQATCPVDGAPLNEAGATWSGEPEAQQYSVRPGKFQRAPSETDDADETVNADASNGEVPDPYATTKLSAEELEKWQTRTAHDDAAGVAAEVDEAFDRIELKRDAEETDALNLDAENKATNFDDEATLIRPHETIGTPLPPPPTFAGNLSAMRGELSDDEIVAGLHERDDAIIVPVAPRADEVAERERQRNTFTPPVGVRPATASAASEYNPWKVGFFGLLGVMVLFGVFFALSNRNSANSNTLNINTSPVEQAAPVNNLNDYNANSAYPDANLNNNGAYPYPGGAQDYNNIYNENFPAYPTTGNLNGNANTTNINSNLNRNGNLNANVRNQNSNTANANSGSATPTPRNPNATPTPPAANDQPPPTPRPQPSRAPSPPDNTPPAGGETRPRSAATPPTDNF